MMNKILILLSFLSFASVFLAHDPVTLLPPPNALCNPLMTLLGKKATDGKLLGEVFLSLFQGPQKNGPN